MAPTTMARQRRRQPTLAALVCATSFVAVPAAASTLSPKTLPLFRSASAAIAELETVIVGDGRVVPDLGAKFDEIFDAAMRASRSCPVLARAIDARCEVVFQRQLRLLRNEALAKLVPTPAAKGIDEYELHAQVDAEFCVAARRSLRRDADWSFSLERASLDDVASAYTLAKMRAADVQLHAAKQQANFMRLYQTYNSQIQHLQASQFSRPSVPLAAGFAYRVGQTDINFSGNYQQGKATLQLTSIDDDTVLSSGEPAFIFAPSKGNFGLSLNA